MELDQLLLVHRMDAERMQETMKQKDAQVQSDFWVMTAEFEKRQVEWVKKVCINKERSNAAIRAEQQQSDEQCKASDEKWKAFVQKLQDD